MLIPSSQPGQVSRSGSPHHCLLLAGERVGDDSGAAVPAAQHLLDPDEVEVVTGAGQGITQLGLEAGALLRCVLFQRSADPSPDRSTGVAVAIVTLPVSPRPGRDSRYRAGVTILLLAERVVVVVIAAAAQRRPPLNSPPVDIPRLYGVKYLGLVAEGRAVWVAQLGWFWGHG